MPVLQTCRNSTETPTEDSTKFEHGCRTIYPGVPSSAIPFWVGAVMFQLYGFFCGTTLQACVLINLLDRTAPEALSRNHDFYRAPFLRTPTHICAQRKICIHTLTRDIIHACVSVWYTHIPVNKYRQIYLYTPTYMCITCMCIYIEICGQL